LHVGYAQIGDDCPQENAHTMRLVFLFGFPTFWGCVVLLCTYTFTCECPYVLAYVPCVFKYLCLVICLCACIWICLPTDTDGKRCRGEEERSERESRAFSSALLSLHSILLLLLLLLLCVVLMKVSPAAKESRPWN